MKITIAAAIAAVLAALALRVVVAGRGALHDGDDWMLRGKPSEAIRSYEAAARWYLPFAPHVDAAYDRLRGLTTGDDALAAWHAIRSAARATRSLWQPHAADLADADDAITRLEARAPGAGAGAGDTTKAREDWYRVRLSEAGRAGIGATILAGLGILLWLGGAIVLARKGIDAAGHLVRRPAVAAGVAIVVGLGAWIVGLYNA